jgi:hypothetical protein
LISIPGTAKKKKNYTKSPLLISEGPEFQARSACLPRQWRLSSRPAHSTTAGAEEDSGMEEELDPSST